jgi:hypothetical protein
MNEYDLLLLLLVAIIAINQFIIRSTAWHHRPLLFWIPQFINISIGSYALLFGLPGVSQLIDVVNWIVGGLFLYHFAHNQTRLSRHNRDTRRLEREKSKKEIYDQAEKNEE